MWFPQRQICSAEMERAGAERRYDAMHEKSPFHDGTFPADPGAWSEKATKSTPYHYRDGVSIYVSAEDHSPDDDFLSWATEDDEDEEAD